MDYLVTGASGLLGNNVVRLLLERGQAVRVLTRATTDSRPLHGLNVEIRRGDIRDPASVRSCMQQVKYVIHAAADVRIGWQKLEEQRTINVEGTRHVATAARDVGARMIHVSSVDTMASGRRDLIVDEDTPDKCKVPCTYVITKREAEQVIHQQVEQGLEAVIVNPGFMLGPWDWKPSSGRMLLAVAQRWIPAAPVGGMSMCDARDVAAAILSSLEHGVAGQRYILAGENLTYLQAWRLFAKVTKRPGPWGRMGPLIRWGTGIYGDLKTHWTGEEGEVNSALIKMSSMLHYYSSDKARRELNYGTRPIEDTVRHAWEWFKEFQYV